MPSTPPKTPLPGTGPIPNPPQPTGPGPNGPPTPADESGIDISWMRDNEPTDFSIGRDQKQPHDL